MMRWMPRTCSWTVLAFCTLAMAVASIATGEESAKPDAAKSDTTKAGTAIVDSQGRSASAQGYPSTQAPARLPQGDNAAKPLDSAKSKPTTPDAKPDAKPDVKPDAVAKKEVAPDKDTPKPAVPRPRPRLTPQLTELRDHVRHTLGLYFLQTFNTRDHTPNEIMNACLPFGCESEVYHAGEKVNGITSLCWNHPCAGYELLAECEGRLAARTGYGLQSYPGQFLAMLALARVPSDYPVRRGKTVRNVADLVAYEKLSCRTGADQGFKLVGLAFYAKPDETWKNALGETWSVERIVGEELDQPINAAPVGGTHRLMGLSSAVSRRLASGDALSGHFVRAKKFIDDYHNYALQLQNADGSWHPAFLAAMGSSNDASGQLRSSGHITQWLALSLPDARLQDPRMVRAIVYLVSTLGSQQPRWSATELEPRDTEGVMHALHALALYDRRVFRPCDPTPAEAAEQAAAEPAQ